MIIKIKKSSRLFLFQKSHKQIGLNIIKKFIDKIKNSHLQKYHINLKEICKVITNINLNRNKENIE